MKYKYLLFKLMLVLNVANVLYAPNHEEVSIPIPIGNSESLMNLHLVTYVTVSDPEDKEELQKRFKESRKGKSASSELRFPSDFPRTCDKCALLMKKGDFVQLFLVDENQDPLCAVVETPQTYEIMRRLYEQRDIDDNDLENFAKGQTIVVSGASCETFLPVFGESPRFTMHGTKRDSLGSTFTCTASFGMNMWLDDLAFDIFNATSTAPDKFATMIRSILEIVSASPVTNIGELHFSESQSLELKNLRVTECSYTCQEKSCRNPSVTYSLEQDEEALEQIEEYFGMQDFPRNLADELPAAIQEETPSTEAAKKHDLTVFLMGRTDFSIYVTVENPDDKAEVANALAANMQGWNHERFALDKLESGNFNGDYPLLAFFENRRLHLRLSIPGKQPLTVLMIYPNTDQISNILGLNEAHRKTLEDGKNLLIPIVHIGNRGLIMFEDDITTAFFHLKLDQGWEKPLSVVQQYLAAFKMFAQADLSALQGKEGYSLRSLDVDASKSTGIIGTEILGFIYKQIDPKKTKNSACLYGFSDEAKKHPFEKGYRKNQDIRNFDERKDFLQNIFSLELSESSRASASGSVQRTSQQESLPEDVSQEPKSSKGKKSKGRK